MGRRAAARPEYSGAACVNPIIWTIDYSAVPAENNPGSVSLSGLTRLEAGVAGAACKHDRLLVGPLQSSIYDSMPMNLGRDNYHLLDYALFYSSIRDNALNRSQAHLSEAALATNSTSDP